MNDTQQLNSMAGIQEAMLNLSCTDAGFQLSPPLHKKLIPNAYKPSAVAMVETWRDADRWEG